MNAVTARFFGGPADGDLRALLDGLWIIRVPTFEKLYHAAVDPAAHYATPDPSYTEVTYEWDGTVNEAGEYRYRWRP